MDDLVFALQPLAQVWARGTLLTSVEETRNHEPLSRGPSDELARCEVYCLLRYPTTATA